MHPHRAHRTASWSMPRIESQYFAYMDVWTRADDDSAGGTFLQHASAIVIGHPSTWARPWPWEPTIRSAAAQSLARQSSQTAAPNKAHARPGCHAMSGRGLTCMPLPASQGDAFEEGADAGPTAHLLPKVMVPYETKPGQTPRKVEMQRYTAATTACSVDGIACACSMGA
jgi:hypothetical protein